MDTPVRRPRIDPKYAGFKMSIRKSKIHRYGVYAEERIPANRKVIEYTGERLNRRETKLVSRIMKGHVIYMSLRTIEPGEEITVDYNFEYVGDKNSCACGAGTC